MTTIPASQLVAVNPSVLPAAGAAVDVLGLFLTENTRPPIGTVVSFADSPSVSDYFGGSSTQAALADIYFAGFDGSSVKPAAMKWAQYPSDAVAAYLRSGDVSGLTTAQLHAINGTLTIDVDGLSRSASVNLSAATSLSNAASIIQTDLNASLPAAASITASIGGHLTSSAGASFTGSGSTTNLTTTGTTGVIHIGAAITGTGVPANTVIVSQTSGTPGGNGVYVTNNSTTSSGDALVATSNLLDVTAVVSGTLHPTDAISGSGVDAGLTILAQLSGTTGGIGIYVMSGADSFASTNVTALSTVLNVTAVGSGSISVGNPITGTGVTADTVVTAEITGTGSTGTYRVSEGSTTVSETMTVSATAVVVAYDSVSGGITIASGNTGAASTVAFATNTVATSLKMTSATGATLSQGTAAAAPGAFMDGLIVVDADWVTFGLDFRADADAEITVREAFASWANSENNRYAFVCWDDDASPPVVVPATASVGYAIAQAGYSGTVLLWSEDLTTGTELMAFVMGAAASIDFEEPNGRITFAFKSQSGLAAQVTDGTIAVNLAGNPQSSGRGNGYNFYGAYGAANAGYTWYQRGFISGDFLWLDAFIDQVWLNSSFQVALLTLMQNARSIPYSVSGYALIEQALADPIQAGLNFGAFAPGSISSAQAAEVNQAAGADIAATLQTQGYYLQVLDASSTVRAQRGSPPCKFWYLDRGSVQALTLDSIAVE